jgi:outer membrane protein TolC
MSRRFPLPVVALAGAALLLCATFGCHPQQPFYFHEDGDLSHYIGKATEIDYPDVEEERLADVDGAIRPFSLEEDSAKTREAWHLTLQEAIHTALANSKVMRTIGGQVLGPPETITRSPDTVSTVYDPATIESNPRFGVEAALSAFDAQLSANVFWEKVDRPVNSLQVGGPFAALFPSVTQQDLGSFQAQLSKTNATGGTMVLRHSVDYNLDETRPRLFMSDWTTSLDAEFRQPLLQGAGVMFNRIAGPGAIPGFNNGVMIARINTDIALADFEKSVRDLVADVETTYWELYFAYRNLDAVIAGRDSALATWQRVYTLYTLQAVGGEGDKEAEARAQYFLFRSAVQQALNALYATEAKLRYVMGIAATDGRLIRPMEEPTVAKVTIDWYESHREALVRNVDLRRARWRVKQREMEMIAAKNYLRPRLDAVGRYSWNGLGDHLINTGNATGNIFDNAYENMTSGRFQDGQIGFEFSMPLGFRKELSGVRHAQLNLARERAVLKEAELEVSHQLSYALREMESNRVLAASNFNRRIAATRQVEVMQTQYDLGTVTIDRLLDAQRQLAQAESDYFRSLVDYNQSIVQFQLRRGTLLDYNGIQLSEGPWPGKAYFDAHRLARERDASLYLDYGYTMPKVISQGPAQQGMGMGMPCDEGMPYGEMMPPMEMMEPAGPLPAGPGPELIPTPAPEPMGLPMEPPEPEPDVASRARKQTPDGEVQPAMHTAAEPAVSRAEPAGPALIAPTTRSRPNAPATRDSAGWAAAVRPAGYLGSAAARDDRGDDAWASGQDGWSPRTGADRLGGLSPSDPPVLVAPQPASGWQRSRP